MDKAASIFFRFDVHPNDVKSFIGWMDNPRITYYLNEDKEISVHMRNLLLNTPSPLITYHFNKDGKFCIVCNEKNTAIGFVKLTKLQNREYEIVYVIGEEYLWGRGYGEKALKKALSVAFLELRATKVHAKIHRDNLRSIRMVKSSGFTAKNTDSVLYRYEIEFDEYINNCLRCSSRG